eukprot:201730_1
MEANQSMDHEMHFWNQLLDEISVSDSNVPQDKFIIKFQTKYPMHQNRNLKNTLIASAAKIRKQSVVTLNRNNNWGYKYRQCLRKFTKKSLCKFFASFLDKPIDISTTDHEPLSKPCDKQEEKKSEWDSKDTKSYTEDVKQWCVMVEELDDVDETNREIRLCFSVFESILMMSTNEPSGTATEHQVINTICKAIHDVFANKPHAVDVIKQSMLLSLMANKIFKTYPEMIHKYYNILTKYALDDNDFMISLINNGLIDCIKEHLLQICGTNGMELEGNASINFVIQCVKQQPQLTDIILDLNKNHDHPDMPAKKKYYGAIGFLNKEAKPSNFHDQSDDMSKEEMVRAWATKMMQ